MVGFGKRGTKVAPHTYPKLPFHGLRALQLLSSLVVGSIMVYFIYYLSHDHWNIPWTFIFVRRYGGKAGLLCLNLILGITNARSPVYRSLGDDCYRSMYDDYTSLLLWSQSSLQLVH